MVGAFALAGASGCNSEQPDTTKQDNVVSETTFPVSTEVNTPEPDVTETPTPEADVAAQDESVEDKEESVTTPSDIVENKITQEEAGTEFTITKEVYEHENVYIEYPQVENLVNQEITDWYNEEFKNTIRGASEDEEYEITSEGDTINETFQITYQSEDMISILIEGFVYVQHTPHPYSYKYGYNINLKTGETMGIADVYSPVEMTDDLLHGENIAIIANTETMEEMDDESFQEAMVDIKEFDRAGMIDSLEKSDFNFYIGEDGKLTKGEESPMDYSVRLPDGKWAFTISVNHALGDCRLVRYDK